MDIQFRILGPIEVDAPEGRRGRVPRGRALSLLALLLVHRGVTVHVDRAVEELWEGEGPQHGRKAVHVLASRLRGAVGAGVVVFEGGGYALRLAPGALDAERFEALARRGREQLASGRAREAATALRQALALWRGPALADVSDERFAQPEIARLEDLRLGCLGDRVDADLACGRHAEVVGELEALVWRYPLRERFRALHMLALYRAGRQVEALEAYRDARQVLVDDLGIEPSPELRMLEAAILRHEVPAPAAPPRAPVAVDARRFVTCVCARLTRAGGRADLDPESWRTVLERYHDSARAICERHGGVVAELRHDAVLAIFGTPIAHEDDPQRALRATAELAAPTAPPFGVGAGCGVGTGVIVAPGVGVAVDTAERLARSAAPGEIRLDDSTWRLVRHGARASRQRDGGFLLHDVDADAPAIPRQLDRPVIGRKTELRRLRAAFVRVVSERTPALIAILGDPGIGKTRLAAELAAIAGDGGRVLAGRCLAHGDGITYWPLREILAQARGDRSIDAMAAALRVAPSVAHHVAAAVGLEPGAAGEDTGWALRVLLAGLARVRPLIVVVDDAHLAEPALLDVLLDVVSRLRDAPVLIVWVARPELLERHPGVAGRIGVDGVLELGPLSAAASTELLAAIASGDLGPNEQRRIAAAAGGNPLFLEQLVAYVEERPPAAPTLPPALHALLAARLDRLETVERSALALGSIVGDSFDLDAVHALAGGIALAELEQACAGLARRDLLVPTGRSLRFRHELLREAAYASLAKSARARLHERHAEWLDALGAELPEADARIGFQLEIACHYEREIGGTVPAELASRAGGRLAAAAGVARGRGDLLGEIGFLDRALALLGTEQEEGVTLLPALLSALSEAGSSDRGEELAERAMTMSATLGLVGVGARSAIERERIRLHRHPERFDAIVARATVERSAKTLEDLGDALGLARAAYMMSDLAWLAGDPVASYAHAERMLGHARRVGSGFDTATALTFMSWALVEGPLPASQAIDRCDALMRRAAGQRTAELALRGCRAVLTAMTGRYDLERESMAEARAGLTELHIGGFAAYLLLLEAIAETLDGDPVAAERAVREAESLVSGSSDRWYLAFIYVDLAHALLAQRRLPEAAEAVARIDTLQAPCDAEWVIKRHTARALLAALAGELEHGLYEARAAVDAAERTALLVCRANAHRTLAELQWAAGRTEDGAAAVRHAVALDELKGNTAAAAETRRRLHAHMSAGGGPVGRSL